VWISHVDIGLYSLFAIYEQAKVKMFIESRSTPTLQHVRAECRNVYIQAARECVASVVSRAKRAHVQSHGFKSRIGYLNETGRLAGFRRGEDDAFDLLDFTRRRLVVCYRRFGIIYGSRLREIDMLYRNVGS